MWILRLTDIRETAQQASPRPILKMIARAETKEALEKYVTSQVVDPYMDGSSMKVFKRGGPLEWYMWPEGKAFEPIINIGTLDQTLQRVRDDWAQIMNSTFEVS